MQKQIFEFPTVNVPLPTDLFLISHAGMTANMALDTIATYSNRLLTPQFNALNASINSLNALSSLDTGVLASKLSSLSGGINNLNSEYLFLSAFFHNFPSIVNFLSAETDALSSDFLNFSNTTSSNFALLHTRTSTITSHLSALDNDVFILDSQLKELSSSVIQDKDLLSKLSSNIDSVSSTFLSYALNTITDELSASVLLLSSSVQNLSSNFLILSSTAIESSLTITELSSNIFELSSLYVSLSSETDSLYSNLISLSSNTLELSSNVSELSSGTMFLSSWVNSIDFTSATNPTIQNLYSEIINVSAYANKLSAYVDSLDFTSATNPLLTKIQTDVLKVSASTESLLLSSLDLYTLNKDLSGLVVTLSTFNLTDIIPLSARVFTNYSSLLSSITSLSSELKTDLLNFNHTLSTNIYDLSGLYVSLSAVQDDLKLTVDVLSATGIADSLIQFGTDSISGRDVLFISASSEVIIQTNQIHNWVFGSSGNLILPGSLAHTTGPVLSLPYTSPIELNLSTTVQKLNSGFYHLKNGQEGQIMYLVPVPNSLGDIYTQIRVDSARYWSTDMASLIRTASQGSTYWIPWMLRSHKLDGSNHQTDPSYDLFPTIVTAIFTDGAWNLSTGRYG